MRLGEILVRDGRITDIDLGEALARQARDGGRVGTVMVEMGVLDLEALTVYLGLELGIPIATRATLERAKRAAVRLLTPEQALLYRCIPVMMQDRQLIVAVDDPLDMAKMEQLARITGYRILPRVAPELRIFYYLERYYGIPRPARYASIANASLAGLGSSQNDLPAPPLPGLPPRSRAPVASDAPAAPVKAPPPRLVSDSEIAGSGVPMPLPAERTAEHQALEHEADELVSALDSDTADKANAVPQAAPNREAMDKAITMELQVPEYYELRDIDSAIMSLRQATRRSEVADAIMSYAVGVFDVIALCIVRDNMAFGWKASGPKLDRERIEALLIPLDAQSMFQMAIHKDGLFHGAPFPGTLHSYLYRVLHCQPPPMAVVSPVYIGDRVVNMLYGHRIERGPLSPDEEESLRRLSAAASDTYVDLIAATKSSE